MVILPKNTVIPKYELFIRKYAWLHIKPYLTSITWHLILRKTYTIRVLWKLEKARCVAVCTKELNFNKMGGNSNLKRNFSSRKIKYYRRTDTVWYLQELALGFVMSIYISLGNMIGTFYISTFYTLKFKTYAFLPAIILRCLCIKSRFI